MAAERTVSQLLILGERVLDDSTHIFEDHDVADEAERLMAFVLKVDQEDLQDDDVPSAREQDRFLALIARRAAGEPFPFLVGEIEFYGLSLKVWPGAFVPRPSSELTVARALKRLRGRKSPVVVDVCAGAAPIALAIAHERDDADVWALDIQEEALDQGRKNARSLGVRNMHVRQGDMYAPLPNRLRGKLDLIAGHVPYVPPEELADLPAEVREHEPIFTLSDESTDGLGLMRRAVFEGVEWLRPGGWMLLEMSDDLAKKVAKMVRRAGLDDHGFADDDDKLSIVVEARKPRS